MQVGSLGKEDPQEEGMATDSSVPAWRIPWTEEPGGQQSMVTQRVGHDGSNLVCTHTQCSKIWALNYKVNMYDKSESSQGS